MTDLIFKSALICNDIRVEKTGKYIAIGIYGPDIVISHEQATVSIACLMQVEAKRPGTFDLEFRLSEGEHRGLVTAGGIFHTSFASKNLMIDFNIGSIAIRAGTEIGFSARETGRRWKHLSSLAVRGPKEQAELAAKIQAFCGEPARSRPATV